MSVQDEIERSRRIMDRLIELTEAGRVRWEVSGQAAFELSLPSGDAVEIISVDGDDDPPFTFVIKQASGRVLSSIRSVPADEVVDDAGKADDDRLFQLYHGARDRTLGVSTSLSRIELDLGIAQDA